MKKVMIKNLIYGCQNTIQPYVSNDKNAFRWAKKITHFLVALFLTCPNTFEHGFPVAGLEESKF